MVDQNQKSLLELAPSTRAAGGPDPDMAQILAMKKHFKGEEEIKLEKLNVARYVFADLKMHFPG